jgi:hypothetical protein
VLKPGGAAILMLYHRHSFNYYARILGYMRLRVLLRILSRAGRWKKDRAALLSTEESGLKGVRGNEHAAVWDIHYENFLRSGWSYLKADRFVHHCTDGPECPYAYVYSARSASRLMAQFTDVKTRVTHFPLRKYPFGRAIPFAVEKKLASWMGWYLILYLRK